MVAVTKKRNYEELKADLDHEENIAIFSCNTCTRSVYPPTGGVEAVRELEAKLSEDGFKVTGIYYLTAACFEDIVHNTSIQEEWSVGIVLACESGYAVVKRFVPERQIIRGLETLGILMTEGKKNYKPIIPLDI